MIRPRAPLVAVLAFAGLTAGCSALSAQTDMTKYYVLTAQAVPERAPAGGFDRSVGLGPLTVPDHLDRYIVTSLADEEITISDTDRWGEPLREALSRVLRQNLVALLGTERIIVFPWDPASPPDLAIKVSLIRFQRTTRGTAEISARWSIERGSERAPVLTKETSVTLPIQGTDTRAAVAALSTGLCQLSRQMATELRGTPIAASRLFGRR